jgi:16S rRNA (cytidine1402-2'-O)-methyltransferase
VIGSGSADANHHLSSSLGRNYLPGRSALVQGLDKTLAIVIAGSMVSISGFTLLFHFLRVVGLTPSHSATIGSMGTLYLVATPIGNLEDITLRALRTLRQVNMIAAEDTRHTKKLLIHYGIHTPMLSFHEHNKETQKERILKILSLGDVALVSDAGTPGLSDPGYELIQAVLNENHAICPIPGPSAPIVALVASGLPTNAFLFLGYLPRRSTERKKLLESLVHESRTMVFFEVPHRLIKTLEEIKGIFGGERQLAVCRELTKLHEEILRGTVEEMWGHFEDVEPRGEFTLVIAGASVGDRWEEDAVRKAVGAYLEEGLSPSQVARQVAAKSKWLRQDVYRITMEEK